MKFQGTLLGLVFKVFAALGGLLGGVKLVAALTAADTLEAKLAGAVNYQVGLGFLSAAVMLWWMAAVVDYLARIAENTTPRAQGFTTAPPPRGSSGSGHAGHDPMEGRVKAEDSTATGSGTKPAGANTYVLD